MRNHGFACERVLPGSPAHTLQEVSSFRARQENHRHRRAPFAVAPPDRLLMHHSSCFPATGTCALQMEKGNKIALLITIGIFVAHGAQAFAVPSQLLRHTAQPELHPTERNDGPRYRHILSSTSARFRQRLSATQNENSKSSSSLMIEEEVVGSGPAASPGDIVTVKYVGRLQSNGKQFDAGTISFKLGAGNVIPGWDQGIAMMQAGGLRKLVIPPELAYGRNGAGGGIIPPNATLEFDVELVGISNGPLAEVMAATGIGSNPRTALLAAFVGLISYLLSNLTFPEDM